MKRFQSSTQYVVILALGLSAAAFSQWLLEANAPTVAFYINPQGPSADERVQVELRKLRQAMMQQARDNTIQANPSFYDPR